MNWKTVPLDEIQANEPRAITDGPFGSNLARRHYTESGPTVIRLQNIGDGVYIDSPAHISEAHFMALRAHEVLPGDLLVSSLGVELPRACLAPAWLGPAIVKADCIRVRLTPEVDSRWVMYSMQRPAVRRWADQRRHGVGRPRLGLMTIRQIPVPLPPLEDQRRIVDILEDHLSRLGAAVHEISVSRQRLGGLRDQLVMAALTGRAVTAARHTSVPQGVGANDGVLPELPLGWTWSRLEDVADVVGGVTKDAKKQSDPGYVEVPYLRVANVQRGRLILDSVTKIRVAPAKAAALRLRPGDVLLNEGGDRDKLARGWVWEDQIELCIHQNHVFRARVRNEIVDPYFLSWTANTIGSKWAERNGKQSVNLASISLSMIRKMPVIIPPLGTSSQIVDRLHASLGSLNRLDAALDSAAHRSRDLRRALLAAAFSGRLTGRSSDLDLAQETATATGPVGLRCDTGLIDNMTGGAAHVH